jgi:hypothetical protein
MSGGDKLCVLNGWTYQVILRKIEEYYVYIGTCYVFDLMEGEAAELLKTGEREIQAF